MNSYEKLAFYLFHLPFVGYYVVGMELEYTEEDIVDEPVPEEKIEEVFNIVEQQPHPIGGYEAFIMKLLP